LPSTPTMGILETVNPGVEDRIRPLIRVDSTHEVIPCH
jgi:hypothetical protein